MVNVAGKTLTEIKEAIEKHLENYFDSPQVAVEVVGYNSATYFVIREDSLMGEDVLHLSITGNETVLDAIGSVGGLTRAASQRIWIARPVPGNAGCEQILPVDYLAITRDAASSTNYQILPGDRVFIAEDGLVATSNFINKMVYPAYQLLNVAGLGANTFKSLQIMGRGFNTTTFF